MMILISLRWSRKSDVTLRALNVIMLGMPENAVTNQKEQVCAWTR